MSDSQTPDWRLGLPVLRTDRLLLREPVLSDAASLFCELCTPEVCRYVPPPPPAVDGVVRLIRRGIERRHLGQGFCFVIQPAGVDDAVGLIQFIAGHDFLTEATIPTVWEWGFGLGSRYWGAGLFPEAAAVALRFAFERVHLDALEAWVVADNRRANRALEKLGGDPVQKPGATVPDGRTGDFVLWTFRNN